MGCSQSKPAGSSGGAQPPGIKAPSAAAAAAAATHVTKPDRCDSPTSPLEPTTDSEEESSCYKPESEGDRLQALLDCKCLDTPDERRFDTITTLLKEMFDVPMALVSLIDGDRLWFKSVAGTECRQGDRLHSFCDASLRAPNPTMMIVPDTLQDARFQRSQFVVNPPHVRFYSGAPLISSEGHVMGSLGILDVMPRSFPAGALNVICNFAELVVREMERERAAAARKAAAEARAEAASSARSHTVRALSCFDDAVLLCNTTAEGWPVLYANAQWCNAVGRPEQDCLAGGLWALFQPAPGVEAAAAAARAAADEAARRQRAFSIAVEAPGGAGRLTLQLRPATAAHLSLAAPRIAVPSFVEGLEPAAQAALAGLYFVVARPAVQPVVQVPPPPPPGGDEQLATPPTSGDHAAARRVSLDSGRTALVGHGSWEGPTVLSAAHTNFGLECPTELGGLILGPMLGRGAAGKVYRGSWKGSAVAVKVVELMCSPGDAHPTGPLAEVALSRQLSHPHIVPTLAFALQPVKPPDADWGDGWVGADEPPPPPLAAGQPHQLWMLLQYCEQGTLGDAIDRGWLRHSRAPGAGPSMRAVLATAQEVASALAYLHAQGVVHGDLAPGNVLLTGSRSPALGGGTGGGGRDGRGFKALVADFGLSRDLGAASRVVTDTFGTVTHQPLELIERQLLTAAADVYAFGVLLWEMASGRRAWAGRSGVQVLYARISLRQRLQAADDWPAGYRALVDACLSDDHAGRPSAAELCAELARLVEDE